MAKTAASESIAPKVLSRRVLVNIRRDQTTATPRVVWQHELPILEAIYGEGNVPIIEPDTLDEGYTDKPARELLIYNKEQDKIPRPSEASGIDFSRPVTVRFEWKPNASHPSEEAVRQGTSKEAAGYAVWPVALLGGLIPNAGYALWLLARNATWKVFRGSWRPDVWYGCLMGLLWMGAFAVYGVSSVYLGALGTSIGWALFQIFMIMTANLSGVLTGEWRSASAPARRGLWTGLGLLAAATALIAAGNRSA